MSMQAAARIHAMAGQQGRSRLATLRSAPPLTVRQTGPDRVHLVGTAAGPLGGDELALAVRVDAGAALTVRSTAATVVLPGRSGCPSHVRIEVVVGDGARLDWDAGALILTAGCSHEAVTRIRLGDGACLRWRDLVVLGRHGETPGRARLALHADAAGRPLLRHCLDVGGPGWDGPAVLGGAPAVGSLLAVGGHPRTGGAPAGDRGGVPRATNAPGDGRAVLRLAGGGTQVCAVGPAEAVRRALDRSAPAPDGCV